MDDLQLAGTDELVDGAPVEGQGAADLFDREEKDQPPAGVTGLPDRMLSSRALGCRRAELPLLGSGASQRRRTVVGPESANVCCGVALVRVSPPWSSAGVRQGR